MEERMSDKNDEKEALEQFLRKELAGVDLEDVSLEPDLPVQRSSKDSLESGPRKLRFEGIGRFGTCQ
jgi:hypothetical protein